MSNDELHESIQKKMWDPEYSKRSREEFVRKCQKTMDELPSFTSVNDAISYADQIAATFCASDQRHSFTTVFDKNKLITDANRVAFGTEKAEE